MTQRKWEIKSLKMQPDLVWAMALQSLRVRITRAFLTLLTVAASSAFIIFLLTSPASADPQEREIWMLMLTLSLIVSGAGVLNTMLMSVTQRYREIGTLKCLGALDLFVLYSVLVESAILGLLGALVGVILGLLLAVIVGSIEFGLGVFSAWHFTGLWWKAGIASGVGLMLTTVGAAIPAYIAAKMPPIEAMRGEK